MTEAILGCLLLIVLVLSYVERKALVDRLMAKDLTDFKANTDKPEKNQESPPDDTIPLEDAMEDIEEDYGN
jgi:hypothetical protein